jgi:hypothetical protein
MLVMISSNTSRRLEIPLLQPKQRSSFGDRILASEGLHYNQYHVERPISISLYIVQAVDTGPVSVEPAADQTPTTATINTENRRPAKNSQQFSCYDTNSGMHTSTEVRCIYK